MDPTLRAAVTAGCRTSWWTTVCAQGRTTRQSSVASGDVAARLTMMAEDEQGVGRRAQAEGQGRPRVVGQRGEQAEQRTAEQGRRSVGRLRQVKCL